MTNKTGKLTYIQWLRLLAAAGVVMLHTVGSHWPAIHWQTRAWAVLNGWDGLVRWCVLTFLMISGALFLPKELHLKDMLRRIGRLAVCWAFWSGVYALGSGEPFGAAFLRGHYHMWYLPFLWGVYLVMPFLGAIVRDRRLENQLLAVSLTIGMGLPWLCDLLVLLLPGWAEHLAVIRNHLNYTFFFDLLAVPVLGHVLSSREFSTGQRRAIYIAGLACLLLTGPASYWATALAGTQSNLFAGLNAPNNLCTAAAIFLFARYHLTALPRIVDSAARASLGIYLIHVLFFEILEQYGVNVLSGDPVWTAPVLAAAVFCLSWAVSAMLGKIPVIGKYLV